VSTRLTVQVTPLTPSSLSDRPYERKIHYASCGVTRVGQLAEPAAHQVVGPPGGVPHVFIVQTAADSVEWPPVSDSNERQVR
jgi:hypothetical protein